MTVRLGRGLAWSAVALCLLYAVFAVVAAGNELLAMLGVTVSSKPRVLPPVFVVHALTGSVALVADGVQLRLGQPRTRRRAQLHRLLGYHSVTAAVYPLALTISGTLNLAVGEAWLRRVTSPRRSVPVHRAAPDSRVA